MELQSRCMSCKRRLPTLCNANAMAAVIAKPGCNYCKPIAAGGAHGPGALQITLQSSQTLHCNRCNPKAGAAFWYCNPAASIANDGMCACSLLQKTANAQMQSVSRGCIRCNAVATRLQVTCNPRHALLHELLFALQVSASLHCICSPIAKPAPAICNACASQANAVAIVCRLAASIANGIAKRLQSLFAIRLPLLQAMGAGGCKCCMHYKSGDSGRLGALAMIASAFTWSFKPNAIVAAMIARPDPRCSHVACHVQSNGSRRRSALQYSALSLHALTRGCGDPEGYMACSGCRRSKCKKELPGKLRAQRRHSKYTWLPLQAAAFAIGLLVMHNALGWVRRARI